MTPEEVEEVLESASESQIRRSRSSGRPFVIGDTATGRSLFVFFDREFAETGVIATTAVEIEAKATTSN